MELNCEINLCAVKISRGKASAKALIQVHTKKNEQEFY